ncbi:LysE family translocator [Paenibacillus vini]|uniref:LysE family translocator n=1 Tax=Paenibacillus vini TaxID=1476024 RepID=UPI0025B686A2|nr:LysE family transporter [Paenibacillus vini]
MITLLKSILIGAAIAAPIGPIGMLCIRSTLVGGWKKGLVAGLGVATADAIYAAVAGFGMQVISSQLIRFEDGFRMIGGLLILVLGLVGFRRKPPFTDRDIPGQTRQLFTFGSTFLLTLANPMTVISFAALSAGLGMNSLPGSSEGASAFTAGIFLGSALWWILLCTAVNQLRLRLLTPAALRAVNLISATLITGFGVWFLISVFFGP